MTDRIRIIEVGPRDGLQNEPGLIPTERKVAFVNRLLTSGVDEVEVTSFVSPEWIPQLADADAVCAQIRRVPGVLCSALVPNMRGWLRAQPFKLDKIAVFTAASESFSRRNTNATIDETFARFRPVVAAAHADGVLVRGYVSTAFHCPFEGAVAQEKTQAVVERLLTAGVDEISLGDTLGTARPDEVGAVCATLVPLVGAERLTLHFHDTGGFAADNVRTAWRAGVRRFDGSVGGLGGCPYAPGAKGNVATDLVVRVLRSLGADVGVDLRGLEEARAALGPLSGRP